MATHLDLDEQEQLDQLKHFWNTYGTLITWVVLRTLQQLRDAGVRVQMHAATVDGMGSFKSQFKKADASGATYALIFGADELARGEVTLKSLRDGSGAQTARPLAEVATWAATLQSPAPNI